MAQSTGITYKSTLNLPRTDFPMRAALGENEPKTLARWRAQGLYSCVQAARDGDSLYNFHDVQPYANGLIHTGHLLNKVLKDLVVRSRTMSGRRCPYVPGWDCHGLPIEHKVVIDLIASGRAARLDALGDDQRRLEIRRACRSAAEKYHGLQSAQFERLLTLADFAQPYLTMTPDYEQGVLEVFADLIERGLVYRALKSVHWSIENRTALAEAELEYEDRTDTAVYVDFEADDREAVAAAFGVELDERPSFMIWTTTPWTLPANLAIAVNPAFRYTLVRVDGSVTVIATELVQRVVAAAGGEDLEALGETLGARLVGLRYRHPFCDRVGPVVAAPYVTLEDGTGLVHTAPGHGAEDNETALREGLEIYCPVQADGTYDDTVPPWLVGHSIWQANAEIVEHLRGSGHLFHSHQVTHSYPHDWRSRTPVIFRATEQWFVGVDTPIAGAGPGAGSTLRQLALDATGSEIAFYPKWGRNRMRGMLESRPDWCISRQRSWGLPIPAFTGPGGEILLTPASVRAVAAVFGTLGSDAWFTEEPSALLAGWNPDDPDAPPALRGVSPAKLAKTQDIFDVWFESGSSWHAVMRRNGRGYPTDLYLEGSDQHRGWFQLSLLPALGATGQAPFRALLTHGFVVDRDGRKMSKSLGNTLDVEDLLKDFGAEVCRWWVSSLAYENDIKMDLKFLEAAGETYRKVRNTLRFLLGNVADLEAVAAVDAAALDPASLDAWVLAEAGALHAAVVAAYDEFAFRRVHGLLYDFCNETLSAVYCAAVKDRLYCDPADSGRRRATQSVMLILLDRLCRLLAPILPHTAEEAFFVTRPGRAGDAARSVHLETWQAPPEVERHPAWAAAMAARPEALRALEAAKARGIENPLDAGVTLPDPEGALAPVAGELADLLGVSRLDLTGKAGVPQASDLRHEPRCDRCWRRTEGTTRRSDGGTLCDRCADAVGV